MVSCILFDLDGTLVDSRADLVLGVNLARRDLGLAPLAEERVVSFVGEGMRNLVARALPECPERLDDAVELTRLHYSQHLLDHTRPYPGVKLALAELRGLGYALGVVTNKPQEFSEAVLNGLGLAEFFRAVVGGGVCPQLKPDPAPLRLALEQCGAGAAGSWMAGDHFTDLESGRRAGLKCCFCRYGFGDPRSEGWDLAVDTLTELPAYLKGGV